MDGRSTPRTGYLKRNGASLSKTTYAALWAWAQHNGNVVAIGDWAGGAFVFADNGDGTFKLPDTRGRHAREWSDGSTLDSGRAFGSAQVSAVGAHKHPATGLTFTGNALPGHAHTIAAFAGETPAGFGRAGPSGAGSYSTSLVSAGTPTGNIGGETGNNDGTETRPVNTAYLGVIKF